MFYPWWYVGDDMVVYYGNEYRCLCGSVRLRIDIGKLWFCRVALKILMVWLYVGRNKGRKYKALYTKWRGSFDGRAFAHVDFCVGETEREAWYVIAERARLISLYVSSGKATIEHT